jgi:hypothetical protein
MTCKPIHPPLALALGLVLASAPSARADEKDDEARAIARKVATAGAAMFDARDAKGLALTYTEDARLEIYGKDSAGALKVENKVGRAEIEAYYAEHFKNTGAINAQNTIDHARWLDSDLITFTGTFVPDTKAEEPLRLPFTQVRVRQGDAWKIVSLQLFIIPKK